jgi:protein SCO1/2
MTPQSRTWTIVLTSAAALLGLCAALLWRYSSPQIQLATGTYLAPARALPDFSLIDQRGAPFGPRNFDGHWSLMFFGYTNCPDFCPTTLITLAAMEKNLRTGATRPQVVFISVDAQRDTPQQLAKYVPYFDPSFIGVTAADQPTIEALARNLGVAVALVPSAGGGYTVDHSGAIFVVDPAGKIAAILTGPFTADALLADFDRIVAVHG